jgi:hypothetical protein
LLEGQEERRLYWRARWDLESNLKKALDLPRLFYAHSSR